MPASISGAQFQFKFKDAENQEINENNNYQFRSVGNKALEFLETITISGEIKLGKIMIHQFMIDIYVMF